MRGDFTSLLTRRRYASPALTHCLSVFLFLQSPGKRRKKSTPPLRLLLPKVDPIYEFVCIHCRSGSMTYQRALLSVQVLLSVMLMLGYRTRLASIGSWILYLSLTLRNTWLNFILDRCDGAEEGVRISVEVERDLVSFLSSFPLSLLSQL